MRSPVYFALGRFAAMDHTRWAVWGSGAPAAFAQRPGRRLELQQPTPFSIANLGAKLLVRRALAHNARANGASGDFTLISCFIGETEPCWRRRDGRPAG